ncbi:MAG: hypothetical protein JW910_21450 [Anaerolineae bacterium]|nr:hypothetical protein [Anaerolineae bacterium]
MALGPAPAQFLRPFIGYVYRACGPQGAILLGDGSRSVYVFSRLVLNTGIRELVAIQPKRRGVPVSLVDLNAWEVNPLPAQCASSRPSASWEVQKRTKAPAWSGLSTPCRG